MASRTLCRSARPRRCAVGLVALAIAAVAGSGCASSKWDTSDADRVTTTTAPTYTRDAAGLTASLTRYLSEVDEDLNQWAAPEDDAECAARGIVERVSVPRLLELKFRPDQPSLVLDYSTAERTATTNILLGCIDYSRGLLELFSGYDKLGLSQSTCLSKGFERLGMVRTIVASMLEGTDPDMFAADNKYARQLDQLLQRCLTEEDLTAADPVSAFPRQSGATTTTAAPIPTQPPLEGSDEVLDGVVPGGPLDTTTPKG